MAATQLLQVKIEPKLKKSLQKIAKYKGLTVSAFVKMTLTETTRNEESEMYTVNGLTIAEENEIIKRDQEITDDIANGKAKRLTPEEFLKELDA